MDFGKFLYQQKKKAQESRKKQKQYEVKEVKFRPNIDAHDYDVKLKRAVRFLAEGDKCKITLRFRGREITHQAMATGRAQRLTRRMRKGRWPHGRSRRERPTRAGCWLSGKLLSASRVLTPTRARVPRPGVDEREHLMKKSLRRVLDRLRAATDRKLRQRVSVRHGVEEPQS